MKNQKGFIQIPLLIAIVIGVIVVGGVSYVGVRQYQSSKVDEPKEEAVITQVDESKKEGEFSEIEKLRQEVEILKKQQAQKPAPTPQPKITPSEIDQGTKVFSEWAKRTVKVTCNYAGYVSLEGGKIVEGYGEYIEVTEQGSGTIFFKHNGQIPFVISNSHLVVYGNKCIISVPNQMGGFYHYQAFAVIPSKDIDVSIFFLADTELAGVQQGPLAGSPHASALTFAKNYTYCKPEDVLVGDKVYILGYPAIGGETITVTEGIISGYEGNFYKTSAKIDEGNSGGVAVLGKKNCYLGIPTSAAVGGIESLGRIFDLTYMERYLKE